MTEKLQVSKRLDDGTIVVVGGDTVDEFAANLTGIIGETGRDEVRALFYSLLPASASEPQALAAVLPIAQPAPQSNFQPSPQAAPAAPQGGQKLCASHGAPAIRQNKKDGSGYFYKCPVNQSIISEFRDAELLKNFCPPPRSQ